MGVTVQELRPTMLCPLLATIFEEFDRAEISYCLLRGHEELLNGAIDGDPDRGREEIGWVGLHARQTIAPGPIDA
jgi:hypothetical protein